MRRTREQVKAELLAEAEVMIDELLKWGEEASKPTLTELEEVLLRIRKRLSQRVGEVMLGEQEAVHPVPGPKCPTCQQEMHYKGMKTVQVESRLGTLELERSYHYCERCARGLFPPGSPTQVMGQALERGGGEGCGVVEWVSGV
jgi:hypothetical protein